MNHIEVATRDKIHLHIQIPISKQIPMKICTMTGILDLRIIHKHICCN
jgi:hypothetical protein